MNFIVFFLLVLLLEKLSLMDTMNELLLWGTAVLQGSFIYANSSTFLTFCQ